MHQHTFEGMRAKFKYDMAREDLKLQKMRQFNSNIADYDELTVTDDDYDEDQKIKYADFLAKRRDRKEKGWPDPDKANEKFKDDPYMAQNEEIFNDAV